MYMHKHSSVNSRLSNRLQKLGEQRELHCIAYLFLLMNYSRTTVGLSTQGISLARTAHKLLEEGSCW